MLAWTILSLSIVASISLIFPYCESTASPIKSPHITSNALPLTRPLNANHPPHLAFCGWPVWVCVHVKLRWRSPPTGGGPHLSESLLPIMSLKLGQMKLGISYITLRERNSFRLWGNVLENHSVLVHRSLLWVKIIYCTFNCTFQFIWMFFPNSGTFWPMMFVNDGSKKKNLLFFLKRDCTQKYQFTAN